MVISDRNSYFPVQPAERRKCFQRETCVNAWMLSQAMAGGHLSPQTLRQAGLGRAILGLDASKGYLNSTPYVRG